MDQTALAFDRAVRDAGVQYAFMGAFAVMAWGEPRATTDVDTLLEYSASDVEPLVNALTSEGLSVAAVDLTDALVDGGHVTALHEGSGF